MRLLLFLLPIFLIDLYVFEAVKDLVYWWNPESLDLIKGVYWGFPVLLIGFVLLVPFFRKNSSIKVVRPLMSFFILTVLSKVVIAGVLLIGDTFRWLAYGLATLFNQTNLTVERPLWLLIVAVLMGVVPMLMLLYGMIRNKYRYRVFREKVAIEDLPEGLDGLKIVQISDIHAGSFTRKNPVRKGVEKILSENPDLVFFTGDLVNNVAREIEPFIPVFSKIKAKYGVFSILGNHDYGDYARWSNPEMKRDNRKELEQAHEALGWQLLNNENEILEIKGAKVAVIGVENFAGNNRFSQYGDLVKAYSGAEDADIRLCLSHDPTHWTADILPNFPDIELTLSGHTHGGQFGFELGSWYKWSPVKYVYKHWAGLYKEAGQYLYVNRGFGFLGYPGRVGILPEITVLELTKSA